MGRVKTKVDVGGVGVQNGKVDRTRGNETWEGEWFNKLKITCPPLLIVFSPNSVQLLIHHSYVVIFIINLHINNSTYLFMIVRANFFAGPIFLINEPKLPKMGMDRYTHGMRVQGCFVWHWYHLEVMFKWQPLGLG